VQAHKDDFLRVGVSARYSDGSAEVIKQLLEWLARAGFHAFIEVKRGTIQPQFDELLDLAPTDLSKDPQQHDMTAYRRRCRHDVLHVVHNRLMTSGAELTITSSQLDESVLLTRLYHEGDVDAALWYWEQRGILRANSAGEGYVIDDARDEDVIQIIESYDWEEIVEANDQPTLNEADVKADVFVCHASEDKESFVRPLVEELRQHVQVWYDEFSLTLGDSLRQKIDQGLRSSRFGVVVLSKAFFDKNWPQYELDGLAQKEMSGGVKVILPIWHGVSKEDVEAYSPSLAGRVAVSSQRSLSEIVEEILRVVK
jgi:hypothetical protein